MCSLFMFIIVIYIPVSVVGLALCELILSVCEFFSCLAVSVHVNLLIWKLRQLDEKEEVCEDKWSSQFVFDHRYI